MGGVQHALGRGGFPGAWSRPLRGGMRQPELLRKGRRRAHRHGVWRRLAHNWPAGQNRRRPWPRLRELALGLGWVEGRRRHRGFRGLLLTASHHESVTVTVRSTTPMDGEKYK